MSASSTVPPSDTAPPSVVTTATFDVPDMDCASCVARIRGRLTALDGVLGVDGSPISRTLSVEMDGARVTDRRVRDEVERLGYAARIHTGRSPANATSGVWRGGVARIAYASMALFVVAGLARWTGYDPRIAAPLARAATLSDLLFVVAALVGGWNFFPRGVAAARALALDMNFLMTVAIIGAVAVGETMEAAAIAFLFALSELLERYAVDRARGSVEALMELSPDRARRIDAAGEEEWVEIEALVVGDEVAVRPGDRVPADGIVVAGRSAIDESPITGEPLSADKSVGDRVHSGTINREGWLRVRVERLAADSTLARIIRLVQDAEGRKTHTEQFVARFARVYTPIVTLAAALVVAIPVLLGAPFEPWFVRGLTLLVIACPCALVISTPVAVVSGITAAARNGVLIKGGRYLEALGEVKVFAFDKTGTLTHGRLAVERVEFSDGVEPEAAQRLLRAAAALERRSEHPLARAIAEHCGAMGLRADTLPPVADFRSVPGRGAEGRVDGRLVRIGAPEWLEVDPPGEPEVGRTVVAARAVDDASGSRRETVWFTLADRPREGAAAALDALRAGGVVHTVMLTGDGEGPARAVAARVGVDEVRARMMPEDKVRALEELERIHGPVAMVGDGVNDAPALAASSVGIVMGAMGSDASLETADLALMGDDLSRLAYARRMSGLARRVIRQNIAAAIVVKALLVLAVPFGWVPLVAAVIVGDVGVSLGVTVNALRLAAVRDGR
ncbi:heavy metal translocating P-type ATPase [Gaopeijia maritima]|uniref:heavy metal translocating P-type ATPase n=1 Tax=Gaopeijia maritima TaxID=3119007 RepID=UPI00328515E6